MTTEKTKQTAAVSKLAYSYRRYSSSGQRDGSSLERQLEMAQDVCNDKGWTLVDLPPDAGLSGYKGINRIKGTLGTFLGKVRAGQVQRGSVIIIEKMDRFSRNEIDLVIPDFLSLLQSGIEIYSCADRTHYTLADIRRNPMTLNYAVMAMAMANDYSKSLGDRITRSVDIRLSKCQQGLKMDLGPWNPRWVDFVGEHKQPGEFRLNAHAESIRRIVREYLAGESMYSIAKGLIRDNVPTLAGGKWAQGTIGHLLGNGTLTGDVELKGQLLKGYFPAVITEKEHRRLQAKLNENKARRGGSAHSDYVANLFRNRCKCAHCGGTITTAKVSRCEHHIYTCKTKRLDKCPSKYSIHVDAVEHDFFLSFLQQSPGDILRSNSSEYSDKVAVIQAEIAKHDKAIAKVMELLDTLSVAELKSKLASLEAKRQEAKAKLDELNNSNILGQQAPQALSAVTSMLGLDIGISVKVQRTLNERVKFHLSNNDTRKRLLQLLPSIVGGLLIDTTAKRYAVVFHNGKQSEWRKVAAV